MAVVNGDVGADLPQPVGREHVRRYCYCHDSEIGASLGERTPWMLVQYNNEGTVHGYPVTESYLRSKGAET